MAIRSFFPSNIANSTFDLEYSRSRSWPQSNRVTYELGTPILPKRKGTWKVVWIHRMNRKVCRWLQLHTNWYKNSRRNRRHLKSSRSLTISSSSRSHGGCVLHQAMNAIDSCPFHSMTIRPPIPKIQFDLENSRSKVKVKGTPVSAASFWLISLVFHIRASYRLSSLSFYDNQASHSRDTIWPWKFKVKGQGKRYPSQRSIQLTHFLFMSHQLDQPFLRYGK